MKFIVKWPGRLWRTLNGKIWFSLWNGWVYLEKDPSDSWCAKIWPLVFYSQGGERPGGGDSCLTRLINLAPHPTFSVPGFPLVQLLHSACLLSLRSLGPVAVWDVRWRWEALTASCVNFQCPGPHPRRTPSSKHRPSRCHGALASQVFAVFKEQSCFFSLITHTSQVYVFHLSLINNLIPTFSFHLHTS